MLDVCQKVKLLSTDRETRLSSVCSRFCSLTCCAANNSLMFQCFHTHMRLSATHSQQWWWAVKIAVFDLKMRQMYLPLSGAARGANQVVCSVLLKVIFLQVQQQQGESGGQTVADRGERTTCKLNKHKTKTVYLLHTDVRGKVYLNAWLASIKKKT